MLITQIQVENFQGVRAARVRLQRPVTLFAGRNFAGKSSLQEAVRMALTGEPVRVALKKEYGALVSDGAKQGYAQVVMYDGQREASATILLPSGKATSENYTVPPALPYLLEAQRFARLDDTQRRAFLFGLMGLKTDQATVKDRLLKRGLDAAKVERILPLLRAGFGAASEDAKKKATEAKGTWRGITGETYGAVKAETWRAVAPEVDTGALRAAEEELAHLDQEIAQANQQWGGLQADKRRFDAKQLELSTLRGKVAQKQRVQAKLQLDEDQLAEWEEKVQAADAGARPQNVLACPCCSAQLVFDGRELQRAPEAAPAHASADMDKLPEYIRSRDLMRSAVSNGKRDLGEIENAERDIAAITSALGTAPDAAQLAAAQAKVQELQSKRDGTAAQFEQLSKAKRAAEAAEGITARAAAAHADVAAWDAIGSALAPDGIPAEFLAEAIGPINDRLAQSALDAEWPLVVIGKDMALTAGGRPYALLSESERWRVDAMVAEAISFQSGLKLLVLDRFDVLDAKGRTDLLAWLHVLAENKEVETALVFGTLKALPADLPATVAGEWIENGHVGHLLEAA